MFTSLSPLPHQRIVEMDTATPPASRTLASSSHASGDAAPAPVATHCGERSLRLGGAPFLPLLAANAEEETASATMAPPARIGSPIGSPPSPPSGGRGSPAAPRP